MGHVGEAVAFGVRTPFERVRNGSGKSDPLPNPEPNGAISIAKRVVSYGLCCVERSEIESTKTAD